MSSYIYRNLHLKKYYIKRWKKTHNTLKNIKIANLKFISKFMLLWKINIMQNKKSKINSIYMIENIFMNILRKK